MGSPDLRITAGKKEPSSVQPGIESVPFVARFGLAMKRHAGRIALIQWSMVGLYLFLLFAPFVFPGHAADAFFWKDLQFLSVFIFWGFGWPMILLSTMIFGRIWCGIFCPDGTLTEAISHYGQKRSIPRWIRWSGWPCLTLVIYTLFLFLSGAAHHHAASAVLLGSLTLAALLTGFLYGNGKRVWCMYLCPSNAVFTFLAKLSPFYFRVDLKKWDAYKGPAERINCAPLINIKQMKSTSLCHACGRCSGYRDAVELAIRKPDREILSDTPKQTATLQALILFFGIIGMGTAVLFPSQNAFGNINWPSLPAMLLLVPGYGIVLGGFLWGMIWLSCRIIPAAAISWQQLSLGLIPLAGTGIFLGLTTLTLSFIEPALWVRHGIIMLQLLLLAGAFVFSLWLGYRLIFQENSLPHVMALAIYGIAASVPGIIWTIWLWT